MLKLLDSSSFYEANEQAVTLLDLSSNTKGLEKKAAHEDIQTYLGNLSPKPGFTYLHINAMTAGEYHGSNRNADFFPEENLRKYYKTFETTPAYVYRSHINKDPARSYGKVIFSIYNERMHRVELICECPNNLVDDLNDRILEGDFPTTSMAVKTPHDTCSICGNKAHSRQEYCTHLRTQLNRLYPDGKKVFAINNGPLTFFDISIVVRPADVNSSILQKVADSYTMGSAELAEIEGLTEEGFLRKKAEFKKLSELVKEITDGCYVVGADKNPRTLGSAAPADLPLSLIHNLHHFDLPQIFSTMADLGISPSINFLAELIARKHLGEGYEGIGHLVQNFINEVPDSASVPVIRFEEAEETNPIIASALLPYVQGSSLFYDAIEKRASGVGYFGNGPHIEPTFEETYKAQHSVEIAPEVGPGKLLLGLGAAALLAKYFITSQIEKKLRDNNTRPQNNVKIVIVKKASDYLVTSQLAKLAMLNSLPKKDNEQPSGFDPNRAALSATKKILVNPNSRIGGKLSNLLRIFSLGSKLTSDY